MSRYHWLVLHFLKISPGLIAFKCVIMTVFPKILCVFAVRVGNKNYFHERFGRQEWSSNSFFSSCSAQGRCLYSSWMLSLTHWFTLGSSGSQAYNCLIILWSSFSFWLLGEGCVCSTRKDISFSHRTLYKGQGQSHSVFIKVQPADAHKCQLILVLLHTHLPFLFVCGLCISSSSIRNKGSSLTTSFHIVWGQIPILKPLIELELIH